ncbi:LSMT-L [Symbiodinium microadriaticum]|nr:LSMT-L [Symbiodinium microadriaticum]
MRRVLQRFARDAGSRANALARAKEAWHAWILRLPAHAIPNAEFYAPVAPLQSNAKELGKVTTGIGNDLSSFATGVSSGVLKGSGTGTAYAPTSPILSQVIQSPTPKPASHAPAATATAPAPAMARSQSLEELRQRSTSELNRMLAERGVSGHSATEKDDLAKWVHQHQHLPVISRPVAQPDTSRKQSWSTRELQQMSVAELKDMLAERGVPEGTAAEKSELVKWVWQHQHLPALYAAKERRKGSRRWGFGYDSEGSRDEPRTEEPERKKLEAPEDTKQLEGESTKLLEGRTEEVHRRWPRALFAALAAVALVVVAVAANDTARAQTSDALVLEDENHSGLESGGAQRGAWA